MFFLIKVSIGGMGFGLVIFMWFVEDFGGSLLVVVNMFNGVVFDMCLFLLIVDVVVVDL